MRSRMRIAAGILVGFAFALGGVGALSLLSVIHVSIDFFGIKLATRAEVIAWTVAWSVVAALGSTLLVATRSDGGCSSE
jgi:hypothetical protein